MNTTNILQFPEHESSVADIELDKTAHTAEQEHFMKIYGAIPLATPDILKNIFPKPMKGLHLKYKHSYSCHKSIKEKCKKN